jgi:hypothetical protein
MRSLAPCKRKMAASAPVAAHAAKLVHVGCHHQAKDVLGTTAERDLSDERQRAAVIALAREQRDDWLRAVAGRAGLRLGSQFASSREMGAALRRALQEQ